MHSAFACTHSSVHSVCALAPFVGKGKVAKGPVASTADFFRRIMQNLAELISNFWNLTDLPLVWLELDRRHSGRSRLAGSTPVGCRLAEQTGCLKTNSLTNRLLLRLKKHTRTHGAYINTHTETHQIGTDKFWPGKTRCMGICGGWWALLTAAATGRLSLIVLFVFEWCYLEVWYWSFRSLFDQRSSAALDRAWPGDGISVRFELVFTCLQTDSILLNSIASKRTANRPSNWQTAWIDTILIRMNRECIRSNREDACSLSLSLSASTTESTRGQSMLEDETLSDRHLFIFVRA